MRDAIAAIDAKMSAQLAAIMHDEKFKALEAAGARPGALAHHFFAAREIGERMVAATR